MAAYRAITETCNRRHTHPEPQDRQWCDEVLTGDKQLDEPSLFQSCTSDSRLEEGGTAKLRQSHDRVLKWWLCSPSVAAFLVSL